MLLGVLLGEAEGLAAGCCVAAGGASLEAPASPVTALQGGLAQLGVSLGCVWLGEAGVALGFVPALPEMAPLWPDSVVAPLEVDAAEPLTPPSVEALEALLALGATLRLSFTPFTPSTDLASFFASFLSALLGTEPVSSTFPLLTEI